MKFIFIYIFVVFVLLSILSFYDKFIRYSFILIHIPLFFNILIHFHQISKVDNSDMYFLCICAPFIEEFIFRFILKYIFNSSHITSILFGLFHIQNYFLTYITLYSTLYQVTISTIIGYIFYYSDSILVACLLHSYYNTISIEMHKYAYCFIYKIDISEYHITRVFLRKNKNINIEKKSVQHLILLNILKNENPDDKLILSKFNVTIKDEI